MVCLFLLTEGHITITTINRNLILFDLIILIILDKECHLKQLTVEQSTYLTMIYHYSTHMSIHLLTDNREITDGRYKAHSLHHAMMLTSYIT
jgi:hypothetical protein